MENVKVSYANLGTYKDKDTGEIKALMPKTDSHLQVVDFKDVWMNQKNLNPESLKGMDGMIFPFEYDIFYDIETIKENSMTSNGLVFVDIDCGSGINFTIMEKMEEINERLAWHILSACTTNKGLHIVFWSHHLTALEYTEEVFKCLTSFTVIVRRVCDIDLKAIPEALDACTFTIKQRFFLRYSKSIYWNDRPNIVVIKDNPGEEKYDFTQLKRLFPELWEKVEKRNNGFRPPDGVCISNTAELVGIVDVDKHAYIEHVVRWRLFDSLCCIFIKDPEDLSELNKQWDRCCELIDPVNHSAAWFKQEPRKNKWLKKWFDSNCKTYDEDLLEGFGYYVGKKHSLKWMEEIAPSSIDDLLK